MIRTLNRRNYKTGQGFFRSLISLGIIIGLILALAGGALAGSPSIAQYTAFPPFSGALTKPNVLLNVDTSFSQFYFAYDFDYNQVQSVQAGVLSLPPVSQGFLPATTYYGYFEPDEWYKYDSINGEWTTTGATTADWKGSFLNWLTMRRVDILKKVIVGGKTRARIGDTGDSYDLMGQKAFTGHDGYQKEVPDDVLCTVSPLGGGCMSTSSTTFTFNNDLVTFGEEDPMPDPITLTDVSAFCEGTTYSDSCTTNYKLIVHRDSEPEGVVQMVGDNVRWGLEFISDQQQYPSPALSELTESPEHGCGHGDHGDLGIYTETFQCVGIHDGVVAPAASFVDQVNVEGGIVVVPCGYYDNNVTVTINGTVYDATNPITREDAIVKLIGSNIPLTPATPLAESLWTATGYFQQRGTGALYPDGSYPVGSDVDPYNYADDPATDTDRTPCAKSFVITITDGEPTTDLNIPLAQQGYGSTYADTSANPPAWAAASTDYFWQLNGSHYIDNVAFYGHADIDSLPAKYRDLRDGSIGTGAVLDGEQYLTHYFIYANFGSGSPDGERLLNWSAASGGGAARNGGFIDSNGDFKPDQQSEYDTDGDGNNDNFFDAKDGYQLEAALISAIYDAISHASSGTAAGMVANTADGEGAIYQAYFYPGKPEGAETRKWLGNITALFVDRNGNLREDNGNDGVLDSGDNIIKMSYSSSNGTEIYKCTYDNETLNLFTCPSTPETDGLDSINPLWDGGKSLWESATANRTIFTTVNGSTTLDFKIANSSTLKPYLRADSTSEADNIIDWIRGDDLTGITDSNHPDGYRKRDLTINGVNNVWKLGDIIHSSPTVVGKPMENYDLLYGDSSYTAFRSKYLKRRQVVYAGANDGMLHAFNAGCYDAAASKYYTDVNSSGNCVSSTTSGTTPLGKELWAFVPRGLLPHLKWLTDPGYTHVYYVDLKPKITDVKIFTDDTTHINGWGTILIGGFRYGGKDITCPAPCNSASPEYFALDITDPLNPKLLWTFSNPALGLSMAYPSVAKIGSEWYAIFASGATDYDAISDLTSFQGGNIFVLKISGGTDGVISDWTENMNFWKISTYETALNNNLTFMADPITVDVDIDYDVDVIYFGENYVQGSTWNTLLRRITTNKGAQTDPLLWKLSTVGNINTIAGSKDVVKRITAAPALAMDDSANLWVFFGTGQFLGASDKNQSDTGAFYALRDGCWAGGSGCTTSYTNLMDISTAIVNKDGTVSGISSTCGGTVSSWLDISTASYSCDGWVMYFGSLGEQADFTGANLTHTGERVSTKPLVLGGLVIWATYIPEDSLCSTEGESNLYAVYYKTGTAYSDYIFSKQRDIANAIAAADAAAVAATKAGDTAAADAAAVEAAALRNSYDTDKVARVKKLGGKIGMPSTLSAGVTTSGTVKGFAGQSTGSIVEIEVDSPISLKSEIMNWANRPIP